MKKFRVGMGAAAVKELLAELDLEALDKELREELRDSSDSGVYGLFAAWR